MPDFIKPSGALTTGEIAALINAKLRDGDSPDRSICNIAPLDSAGPADVSFLDNSKYLGDAAVTRAGACLAGPRFAASLPPGESDGGGAGSAELSPLTWLIKAVWPLNGGPKSRPASRSQSLTVKSSAPEIARRPSP